MYVCCTSLKLSIVIVNYNVKHFLEQCLKSVYQAIQNIEAEIFVVDNNSVDGSQDMVLSSFPGVNLIANSKNTGFSTANNQAIKKSTWEYILLLNPDTIVPENCFHTILEFADQTPDLGACGLPMFDGQGNYLPESKRGLPTPEVAFYKMIGLNKLFPKSKKFGKYHLGYLPADQNHEVEILAGAFMLIRKEVLDKIGLLDETFFMYGEDIDLSYRITKAGWKNYYFAGSRIIHYKGESTKKLSTNYVKIFYKAMVIFAEKHYAGSNQKLFKLFINMAIYGRASISLISTFVQRFWLATVESILIFFSLFLLKEYWEEHIKGITSYPEEMLTIHLPYYTLVWILSIAFNGSYQAPFDFSKLARSILIGTLGDLGGAYMGLQLLEREKQVYLESKEMQPDLEGKDYIVGRQLRPEARKDIIDLLEELNVIPSAMIDISDGLSSEIFHLCKQSKIGAKIYEDKLPIDQLTYDTALEFNLSPTTCAMNGGEDYELLFTIPQSDYDKIKNSMDVSIIGYCTASHEGKELITKSGNVVPLEAQGWENFKEEE